jgi:DNA-binding MarR family transcriptional regulator
MRKPSSPPDVIHLADINQVIHAPARLMILTHLYVVESVDYVFLMRVTGLTWGNLSTHLAKLEEAGYVVIKKGYKGKKPQSTILLSKQGRKAFQEYRKRMKKILDNLPG